MRREQGIKLSFIVIGRNEGWRLTQCLESINETIKLNQINYCEIIYVDSKSTDDSINRAKQFNKVKICKLTNDYNAAIARNVGASIAKGKIFLFLDGDMELLPMAFSCFYSNEQGLEYPFMSGNLIYYYYNDNWELESKDSYPNINITKDTYQPTTGGLFLITRDLWQDIGGMKNYQRMGEDPDLGFRLAKKGYLLLRKKVVLVNHHTISYYDVSRNWKSLINGSVSFGRSILYRENFFNLHCIRRILKFEKSALALVFLSILSIVFQSVIPLFIYSFPVFYKALKKKKNFSSILIYFILRDLVMIFAFFFFYPNKKMIINYYELQ